MVFVLIQANLAYRLSGRDASLSELRRELSMLGELLSLERDASLALSADLSRTQSQLANTQQLLSSTQDELAKARTALDDANTQNNSLAEQLAAVTAQLGYHASNLKPCSHSFLIRHVLTLIWNRRWHHARQIIRHYQTSWKYLKTSLHRQLRQSRHSRHGSPSWKTGLLMRTAQSIPPARS